MNVLDKPLDGFRILLDQNPELRKLSKNLLMLKVMKTVGQETIKEISMNGNAEKIQDRIIENYVQILLERKKGKDLYEEHQMRNWLTVLATKMNSACCTLFYIDGISPTIWLQTPKERNAYFLGTGILGFLIAFWAALPNLFTIGYTYFLLTGLVGGSLVGSINLLASIRNKGEIRLYKKLDMKAMFKDLPKELLFGLLLGLLVGFVSSIAEIHGHQVLYQKGINNILNRQTNVLELTFIYGLFSALMIAPISALLGDLTSSTIDTKRKMRPNERFYMSLSNALVIGTASGMPVFLTFLFTDKYIQNYTWRASFDFALGYGFIASVFFGLVSSSGKACIQHFILRILIWHNGDAPWNFARFLDLASKRHFLTKNGSSYMFYHAIIREYFAGDPPPL